MAPVLSLLASTFFIASIAVAAPLHDEVGLSASKRSAMTIGGRTSAGLSKIRKVDSVRAAGLSRRKRQVLAEDEPQDERAIEYDLSGLSGEQLAMLANIVQNELDRYDPNVSPNAVQIVELPREMFADDDSDDDSVYEDFGDSLPRDKRAVDRAETVVLVPDQELEQPIGMDELPDDSEQPQIIFVPEEVVEEQSDAEDKALADAIEEIELRARIAELAQILNERAMRGL